jgi:hypothetical protein
VIDDAVKQLQVFSKQFDESVMPFFRGT